jgi:hypothetical protein
VTIVGVGLDGGKLVSAHLDGSQRRLANIRRDPRALLWFEAERGKGIGMCNT